MNRPLVVLESFPQPRPTTNPYLIMLADSIAAQPGVELRTFSWRRALLGPYDVFHVHWPEILVNGHSPLKKLVRQALFVALLLRLRFTRTPLVRTLHNLELPTGISRRETFLLRWAERWTTLWVTINESTSVPHDRPSVRVLHGHYRPWFKDIPKSSPVAQRLGYFGLIRHYKGVEALVAAFHQLPSAEASLRVGGRPSNPELAEKIQLAADGDPRIRLDLTFLPDDELVALVTESQLVVLPYLEMHNSGGALTALSLDRPILIPDNATNRRLADEVGPGWVFTYQPPLTTEALQQALDAVARAADDPQRGASPELAGREWPAAGAAHVAAFRRAIRMSRGTP